MNSKFNWFVGMFLVLVANPVFAAQPAKPTPSIHSYKIDCRGDRNWKRFGAEVKILQEPDGSESYFGAEKAQVVIGYMTANLQCGIVGDADQFSCVGFWFGMSDRVALVSVNRNSATVSDLKGDLLGEPVDLQCEWSPAR